MRELFVVNDESTETSLVLRTEDGEEFFLDLSALDDAARAALGWNPPASESGSDGASTNSDAADSAADAAAPAAGATLQAVGSSTNRGAATAATPVPARPLSDRLTMRPPEIQNRIRAGASVAELAEEMNVPESRVEPFAHPVLLERARMAELAKMSHPVREDGPATLTLFEILSTAFAARGHSLAEATWDAYRIKGEPWTVRVSWTAGLSQNEAEWTLKQSMGSPDTAVARNTVAADLTDPDFVQPVRTLTSLGRGRAERRMEAIDARDARDERVADFEDELRARRGGVVADILGDADTTAELETTRDDIPVVSDAASADDGHAGVGAAALVDFTAPTGRVKSDAPARSDASEDSEADADEDFLQNPDPTPKPSKRRRKAVTPAWEDVLLGVRANTKRPRD